MSDEYTPATSDVRDQFAAYEDPRKKLLYDYPTEAEAFDRWLAAHDAATRTAALEEAARDLLRGIGIQSTNGIGWAPTDSLYGAGRYLLHISHAAKVAKS